LPKEADVITLDLNRTKAAQDDPIHYASLKHILEVFSVKYKDTTSYFQGLNFTTSFLLKTLQDKETVFRILCHLNETIFRKMINKQHPNYLPLIFHYLDRLVEINFPQLNDHFCQERITGDQYASPFLITLFTSMYNGDSQDNLTIFTFWDILLTENLIGLLKILLGVLKVYHDKFMSMKFEEFLLFWNDLPSRPEFLLTKKFVQFMDANKVVSGSQTPTPCKGSMTPAKGSITQAKRPMTPSPGKGSMTPAKGSMTPNPAKGSMTPAKGSGGSLKKTATPDNESPEKTLAKDSDGRTTKPTEASEKSKSEKGTSSFELEIGSKMRNFKTVVMSIRIDEGTLDGLKGEFDYVKENANDFWNKWYTNKIKV
jgi:hypothetical protein